MHVINILTPVFLIIALGAIFKRTRFFSPELIAGMNRLVYWVGLPCLLFLRIATATYDYQAAGKTFIVVLAGMAVCIVLAYVVSLILSLPGPSTAALVQGAYRGNLLYIGLSIVIYSFANSTDAQAMENVAVLVLAFIVPFYNMAAVVVLLAGQHKIDRSLPIKMGRQLVINPPFIACIAGIIYSAFSSQLPVALDRTFEAVGKIALPLALFGIGGTLAAGRISMRLLPVVLASVIKVAAAPVLGFFLAKALGLGLGETKVALVYLTCPAAVVSYVMADQLKADSSLAAAIVMVSTIFSIASLGIVVALF